MAKVNQKVRGYSAFGDTNKWEVRDLPKIKAFVAESEKQVVHLFC